MRLEQDFFSQDVLVVAPGLIGKSLCVYKKNKIKRFEIFETEAYRGEEDLACHANKGRTSRTEVMYHMGGKIYVYLIYGMYWLLNFVTGKVGDPQAVLIRGVENINGPGKLGRALELDRTYYGESLIDSGRIWVEDTGKKVTFASSPRIGIDYAGDKWKNKEWRYIKTE